MKPVLFTSSLCAIAFALIASAPAAQAGDRSGVNWSVSVGTPGVAYAPPMAYPYPQPVYVQPQPVYVQPPPVVVYGAPGQVVYGQPYYVERPRHHHHHRDDDYNGGNYRQGAWGYRGRD